MAKESNRVKLLDNSFYLPNNIQTNNGLKLLPNVCNGKSNLSFIKVLCARTIEELKADEGGILVWPHSFKECKDELGQMIVLDCKFHVDGKIESLRTGNLVGWIGDGKAQIEINSRFSSTEGQDYFLYYMLSKVFHANIVNMEVGTGSLKELNLLIFMFPRLLREALIQGLFKQYVKREYNDSNIQGTIDVNRHLRYNYPPNGRIAYRTKEFSYDNSLTQLIRHTIEYMNTLPMGRAILNGCKETEECVRMIVQATPSYQKSARRQVLADNRKVVSHPYFTRYKALQRICLAILRNERISHGEQSDKVHGMLIDVAWLWEEYLACVLAENTGFTHHTSDNAFHLFDKGEETFQKVIPDYLDAENKLVADAKYIPLHRFDRLDAERGAAIYYKTIMYMYRFNATKGFLFHPCNQEDINYIKEDNEKPLAFTINEDLISSDYKIVDREGYLYELGMIIPNADNYETFCDKMRDIETQYKVKIQEYIIHRD
jgi:5-methylcytosine-specific restriction endonuclease McrBC regulatory subunit McrC